MNIDAQILAAMRSSCKGVSGAELSQQLGISRAAVWARIEEMRACGYEILASPHQGYRLVAAPDALIGDDIMSRLPPDCLIGRDVRVFKETRSTNDLLEKMAWDDVSEGLVVFAESQTRGRGRLGRQWVSPPGKGLWFSILLRPKLRPERATRLTVAASTAWVRCIADATGLNAEIKWPNDVLIRGKKVAGVLTELSAELDHIKHVILGIGINVNLNEAELAALPNSNATSLRIESNREVDRIGLAADYLREFEKDYRRIQANDFEGVAMEWERHCTTMGRMVRIQTGDRSVQGRAESLDDDGALMVRTQHGHLERIIGGDVRLEPLEGAKERHGFVD